MKKILQGKKEQNERENILCVVSIRYAKIQFYTQ